MDDFQVWLNGLLRPAVLLELFALLLCTVLAWGFVIGLRRNAERSPERNPERKLEPSIWFGTQGIDGALFPIVLLCQTYGVYLGLKHQHQEVVIFKVAIPMLMALVVIRIGAKVLHAAFAQARWARALEHSISWMAWLSVVLWVSGLLPMVLNELDQINWKMGNSTMSVRTLIEGLLTTGAVLIVTLWVSAWIEKRLLHGASGGDLSLRTAFSHATRAILLLIGLVFALSSAGIDLTALSVLGGALGVGVGLGLQKLAANYISGFVILAERSMRIGDSVRVDNFEGQITHINARYTVVRSIAGREAIIPNELLINNRVENFSLADPKVVQKTHISVGYHSDVDLVRRLLVEAALAQPRVLRDPSPAGFLAAFGENSLEFTLQYWIADIEKGELGLRSDINLAILKAMRENSIEIPFPQRVVHQR
ncbi:MAG: Mechanosensitive channel MscK precursor [Pseudomonadota bacterium]